MYEQMVFVHTEHDIFCTTNTSFYNLAPFILPTCNKRKLGTVFQHPSKTLSVTTTMIFIGGYSLCGLDDLKDKVSIF